MNNNPQCPDCGSTNVRLENQPATFTWGAGDDAHKISYIAKIRICPQCNAEWSAYEDADARMQAIYLFLAKDRQQLRALINETLDTVEGLLKNYGIDNGKCMALEVNYGDYKSQQR